MAVLSSSVEFAWQAAENLSEGGVVRLLMTALQQLECLLMTTFPRTERLLMTILCSACQCFFLLCLFQLVFWAILLYFTSMSLSDSGPIFVCLSLSHSMLPNQTKFTCFLSYCCNSSSMFLHLWPLFFKIVTCICKRSYVRLSKLLHAFVKACTYISHPMANKTMPKFEEDFWDWLTFCCWMEAKFSQNFFSMLQFATLENTVFMQTSLRLFEDKNNHWTNLLSF